jgi:hypothetical protein
MMSDKWISCDDRLPSVLKNVLVTQAYQDEPLIAYISMDGLCWDESCDNFTINGDAWHSTFVCKVKGADSWDKITHWQPLPEPKKATQVADC